MSLFRLAHFSRLAEELGKTPEMEPLKLQRLQSTRFRELVRFAAENSPFYQRKLRGIYLNKIRLDQIPPTTKQEMRDNLDAVFTDRSLRQVDLQRFMNEKANLGKWFKGKYLVSHTSGSQGVPLTVVQDRFCIELMYAITAARTSNSNKPNFIEGVRRLLKPKRVALVTFDRGFYPSGAGLEFMKEIVGPYVRIQRFSSMQPDLVEQLNAFQPNKIVGYASVLDALTNKSDQFKLRRLQEIANTSEQLFPQTRTRIEQTFGVPVADHYGMGECLFLADTCNRHQRLHLNADWGILEVVDDHYEPVSDGKLGTRVLLTNLANRVQPFIRYEVTDRVAFDTKQCACGSCLPVIKEMDGRHSDLFWVGESSNDRFLSGVLFNSAVDKLGVVREWQAVQSERNKITVRLELLPNSKVSKTQVQESLSRSLSESGLPEQVVVESQIVDSIPADRTTGKQRRMLSRINSHSNLTLQHS